MHSHSLSPLYTERLHNLACGLGGTPGGLVTSSAVTFSPQIRARDQAGAPCGDRQRLGWDPEIKKEREGERVGEVRWRSVAGAGLKIKWPSDGLQEPSMARTETNQWKSSKIRKHYIRTQASTNMCTNVVHEQNYKQTNAATIRDSSGSQRLSRFGYNSLKLALNNPYVLI